MAKWIWAVAVRRLGVEGMMVMEALWLTASNSFSTLPTLLSGLADADPDSVGFNLEHVSLNHQITFDPHEMPVPPNHVVRLAVEALDQGHVKSE